jgi:hypothetical protein
MKWIKSSRSGGSGNGSACVEVARDAGRVYVRDTKDRDGGMLSVSAEQWSTFLTAVTSR